MAKDIFHDLVKTALESEGWIVTHNPLTLKLSTRNLFIDLGAERFLAAERDNQRIAVEVKSFVGLSPITDFYKALGQYQLYVLALKRKMPERVLHLAMPYESYQSLMSDELLAEFLDELSIRYILFDPDNQHPIQWIN